eukprot:s267_g17.t1
MPKAIDWNLIPDLPAADLQPVPDQADPSNKYEALWDTLEQEVDTALQKHRKPKLHLKQKGRGRTREVCMVPQYDVPPKCGRAGDVAPTFHGSDLCHARWLRQMRRLVIYAKLSQVQVMSLSQQTHSHKLWNSILYAKGFAPNFAAWWNENHGHQAALGEEPPGTLTAQILAKEFETALRLYEKQLLQARIATAKTNRSKDPQLIFKDLKGETPLPCQTLLHKNPANVMEVDHEESAIQVDTNHEWDVDKPLITPSGTCKIMHADHDKIWVDRLPENLDGTKVHQEEVIGNVLDMFDEFRKELPKRWDKHLQTPDEFWSPVVDFTKLAFPSPPSMEYSPITIDLWKKTLRKKSKKAATGPDGAARADLLHMPDHLTSRLLEILHDVETSNSQWPEQMMQAFVIALAKTSEASSVNDYRPISIFPVAYRTWSSIRARQVIQHLATSAPETCEGNLPHKSAYDVWFSILTDIELAQHTGSEISGSVLDLVKCFNLLPRIPLLQIMTHLGIAPQILNGWGKALTQMRRRFKLRNQVGPAIASVTGFAEGCALSVTAMLSLNLVAHRWMARKFPRTNLWSFVDNLELTSPDAKEATESLQGFCSSSP